MLKNRMILRRLRFCLVLGLWGGLRADQTVATLSPTLAGELSGKFQLNDGTGLPEIAWRLKARAPEMRSLGGEIEAEAPGLSLRATLTFPDGAKPGTWRLHEAKVEVAEWWRRAAARAQIAPKPADLRVSGQLRLTGEGTWSGTAWSGVLRAVLAQGAAGSDEQAWTAQDVAAEADLVIGGAAPVAVRRAEVMIASLQVAGVPVRQVQIAVDAGERGQLAVQRAQLEVFGGRIVLAPFALDPAAPAVRTIADFSQIALGELAALVPQALAEARGQVAGRVAINWSLKAGARPDAGGLDMAPGAPATFRLAKSPGLLTGRTPPRIAFFPTWTGPLRAWFSAPNPAYETLRGIELGETPLTLDSLQVRLLPDGPDGARTASVEVAARPTIGTAVERVTFSINLSGPLTQVLRLGLDERTRVRMAPGR